MAANLLSMITDRLGGDFAAEASRVLGESEASTGSAMAALVPSVLGMLASKGSTPEGARGMLDLLKSPQVSADAWSNLESLFAGGGAGAGQLMNSGQSLVDSLLGGKAGSLVSALSSSSGMKSSSATSLVAMVVPLVLGFVKKFVGQSGLDATGLANLLAGQGEHLKGALDGRLAGVLGLSGLTSMGASAMQGAQRAGSAAMQGTQRAGAAAYGAASGAAAATSAGAAAAKSSLFSRPLLWIGLVILGVLALLLSRCTGDDARRVADAAKQTTQSTVDAAKSTAQSTVDAAKSAGQSAADAAKAAADAATAGVQSAADAAKTASATVADAAKSIGSAATIGASLAMKSLELPGGTKVDAPATGFIASVIAHLDGTGPTGRGIAFDDLHFATGSASLDPKSKAQIEQLGAVLKAYSSAAVNLEGFTDNTGNPAANKELSQNRANTVKSALAATGVPAARMTAVGRGSDSPAASNDTSEGRAMNRRVELVVTKR